jgi:O-acetyl-ADP-ribose deacetylase
MQERTEIIQGDITTQECDAIVNAANSSLLGGGGVDGAIHRAAGPELLEACRPLAPCPTGEARMSLAFKLKAKYIIHTVGPVWHGGNKGEEYLLAECYRNSLHLALQHKIKSLSFPAISTGIYGFPIIRASQIAISTTLKYLSNAPEIEKVFFVCFSEKDYHIYQETFRKINTAY